MFLKDIKPINITLNQNPRSFGLRHVPIVNEVYNFKYDGRLVIVTYTPSISKKNQRRRCEVVNFFDKSPFWVSHCELT